jgi:hypothetical protein
LIFRRFIAVLGAVTCLVRSPEGVAAEPGSVGRAVGVTLPVRVDRISIRGLMRTREEVVRREIGFNEGTVVSQEDIDLAVARLWNTTIFAYVQGYVASDDGEHIAIFELEDRWTLNPLLSFGSGGGAFFVRAGATDNNIAGRFVEAYALYENFEGLHGGQLILREQRLFGRRVETSFQIEQLTRPRVTFADRRTLAAVEGAGLAMRDQLRIGVRVSAFLDRFVPLPDSQESLPASTETLLVEPGVRIGRTIPSAYVSRAWRCMCAPASA